MKVFDNENDCIEYFKQLRWKNGVECPFCNSHSVYHFSDKERFKCKECKKIFSFKVGSVFENSRLPLMKWFKAINIIITRPQVSSVKLAEELDITQKTAWMMMDKFKSGNVMNNDLSKL
jgi:transposase-like protein